MTEAEKRERLEARRLELQREKEDVTRTALNHVAGIDERLKVIAQQLAMHDTLDETVRCADLAPDHYVGRMAGEERG